MGTRDGWEKPDEAADDNAHLMVQCMETWFLADKDGLAAYFGQGFNRNALPGRQEIEDVAKDDLLEWIEARDTPVQEGRVRKGAPLF